MPQIGNTNICNRCRKEMEASGCWCPACHKIIKQELKELPTRTFPPAPKLNTETPAWLQPSVVNIDDDSLDELEEDPNADNLDARISLGLRMLHGESSI